MITIFAVPKPFEGKFKIIQENAIFSWTQITPKPEIIIFGNEKGTAEICKKYSIKQIKNIKKNSFGTPIISDIFTKAKKESKNEILMYVNCDIILMANLEEVIKKINFEKFFITGRRWNIEVDSLIVKKTNWLEKLEKHLKKTAILYQVGALDYFIFNKTLNLNPPPFALGRGVWDNWLLYRAKFLKVPVIDSTLIITAVHQNHDNYHGEIRKNIQNGPEWKRNQTLAKDKKYPFNLYNSDYELSRKKLNKPQLSIFRIWRNFQIQPAINPKTAVITFPLVTAIELIIKIYQKIKSLNI